MRRLSNCIYCAQQRSNATSHPAIEYPAFVEPWLDERCANFAIKHCPGLIRRTRADDLTLVPVTSKRQVEFTMEKGWFEVSLGAQSREEAPAMWVIAIPVSAPGFASTDSEVSASSALMRSTDGALLTEYSGLSADQRKELMRSWH